MTSLQVGCSLGRGAADALSDIDAALGVDARPDGVSLTKQFGRLLDEPLIPSSLRDVG